VRYQAIQYRNISRREMESIRRKMYRFVGEWNELAVYEKIAQIID
jgi:hypothetical protein